MIRVPVRDYSVWLWFALPLWCLTVLVLFPPHQLDVAISSLFFDGKAFFLKRDFLFDFVLYKTTKAVPIFAALVALGLIVWNIYKRCRNEPANEKALVLSIYTIGAMLLCIGVVAWLKATTGVYCPWSVDAFAGQAAINTPSWSWVFQEGHCWPAGHAGTGFCLFALYFALRDTQPQRARNLLIAVFIFGVLCSAGRIVQGAHFLSHTIATSLIDWLICATLYVACFDRTRFIERLKSPIKKIAFNHFLFRSAFFWTLCFNAPFLSAILKTADKTPESILTTLILLLSVFAGLFFISMALIALLGLLPYRLFNITFIGLSLLGLSSVVSWLYYGIAMTPDMIRNFLATDFHEASGYWSWHLAGTFILLSLPIVFFICTMKKSRRKESRMKRLGICLVTFLCGVFALFMQLQPFSAMMRQDKSMRYLIAPVNIVYSTGSTLLKDENPAEVAKQIVDTAPITTTRPQTPTLFVVVVGETARSANWQLAGYEEPTNPLLSKTDIVNIPRVQACGTSTDVSLPCMFSRIGRRDYDRKRIISEEALPSLLKRAGWNVTWVENQSGCKGVCKDVTVIEPAHNPKYCQDGSCLDEVMVESVKTSVSALKGGEQAVLFLHMMGSHGPAYYKRSTEKEKVFGKECTDSSFKSCTKESIRAAYDSSIRYTDKVLGEMIHQLKRAKGINTALIYVSDHGESLGENGLYLHGAPYYIAPDEQKVVPMVMWLSEAFQKQYGVKSKVIENNIRKPVTHDHLYHTILGLLNVRSSTYEKQWDLSAISDS